MNIELLEFNENLMNHPGDVFSYSSRVLNRIDAKALTWQLKDIRITTPTNQNAIEWRYSAYVPQIVSSIHVDVLYLPKADNVYVYNETLSMPGGSLKISVSANHWNLLTRPELSKSWATSSVFQVTSQGEGMKMASPTVATGSQSSAANVFPFKMTSSEMPGAIQAITNGQSGDPGVITPLVKLNYNSSSNQAAGEAGGQSFTMATYFFMPSTSNVTFAYDIAFQLTRTPIPPPKKQIMGSTAGFAILMVVIILLVIFAVFAAIMWKQPRLRRKVLPCLGRAADPVEYL